MIKKGLIKLSITFIFVLFASVSWSQEVFTPEHMWNMQRVSAPSVSPDGEWSVFAVTIYDIDKNSPGTYLYLLNNDTKEKTRITHTGKDSSPVFSPDGEKIAFTSRRDDGPAQLYVLNLSGGEARKITDLPVGTFAPKWFPDGKKIAFAANIHPDYEGDFDKLEEILQEQRESKVTAKVTENNVYRFWDRWLTDGFYPRLFKVELENKEVTDLMPDTSNFFSMMGGVSYDISPDGKEIAVSMNATKPPYEQLKSSIFVLKTDGSGEIENITKDNPANDVNPVYSPDGNYILYGKNKIIHFYADKIRMVVYDRNNKTHNNITEDIDLSCQQWIWSDNGNTIYFHAEDHAMKSLFSIPADGGDVTEIYRGGTADNVTKAGRRTLIFTQHELNKPTEIYKINTRGRDLTKLTGFNDEMLSGIELGDVENITYKGANDADIQMFIIYPPDFDPDKKYPLVFMIHGGPHGTFGDQWHYRWNAHLFSAPGYVVAMPNFHGSTSFGQEFTKSIHGNHADLPYRDIMKAADYMEQKDYIDGERMAATGGSYGGYMVTWIAGQTERFAALVNHAGVFDLNLQFASDFSANRGYQYGGSPWDNPEQMQKINPASYAENFSSPMLVIHGELDYRVPVAHGFLVYNIYKNMGLDARLVYYPDENHWILTPQNSLFWYDEFYNWLDRYLKQGN